MINFRKETNQEADKLLDSVGWAILCELQNDARIPFSELGRRVGLSSPAVAERVRRMENAGIITGYHAEINLPAVGLGIIALLSIRTYAGKSHAVSELARATPEVMFCHEVTGIECYFMKVAVRDMPHLNYVIKRFDHCGHLTTSLILTSPVEDRVISPNDMAKDRP